MIVSRDNVARLRTTLPLIAELPCPIVLIDDSTTASSRRVCRQLVRKLGLIYHGLLEQAEFLRGAPMTLTEGLVMPLGQPGWTLSYCRNYSLLLARSLGFARVVLLDDDITIPSADLLAHTFDLLAKFDFVGARTVGLADDSVVGHAARALGVEQYNFVTGQYLGIRTQVREWYFPYEYNEDLIFLMLAARPGTIARYGTVRQLNRRRRGTLLERALLQEAGEVHCEGCFRMAIDGEREQLLDPKYWETILSLRWSCLEDLLARDQAWARARYTRLLAGVLAHSRRLPASSFSRFYEAYFALRPRWVDLQRALA